MLLAIWVALTCLTLIGLGAFAVARSAKSKLNRSFGLFMIVLAAWVLANFIDANYKANGLAPIFAYIDFLAGPWLGYTFWSFTRGMLEQTKSGHTGWVMTKLPYALLAVVASLSSLTHAVVHIVYSDSDLKISYGQLYPLYAAALVALIVAATANLVIAKHKARNGLRTQLTIMIWAVEIAAVALVTANLAVPLLTNSSTVNLVVGNLSYIGLVVFAAMTTYAIVKHRLFDVRLVVARSIAYTLILFVLVTAYTIFAVALSTFLPSGRTIALEERVFYIASAIALAFAFPTIKEFFDRLSNHFFYRDAYDPQDLLNTMNKTLVASVDLTQLLDGVLDLMSEKLKAEFCMIALADPKSSVHARVVGTTARSFSSEDMHLAHSRGMLAKYRSQLIVTDDLTTEDDALKRVLTKNGIAVLAQLGSASDGNNGQLGHLILGTKKSGNPYNSQDIRIIETIANELVIAIQNALRFEEIERFNATLQEKVEEATRKLRRTNDKLRKLDETKDDFISMASHQLRTPLTSVKGYVSMVLDGDGGELTPMQRKLLTQSFISAQRMVYLISDLLNVSRLRTGKFIIEPSPVNLAQVVKDEVGQLLETAKSRGVELVFDKPDHFPALMLDDTKIRQVIMNFLDNAIYYTPRDGKIEVHLKDMPKSVELTVSDNGIGVPRHEQPHLFTKFYRADNAKRARPDGTGLGLFMAKKVVIAQGGAIIFKSTEGKGSTFGFTFAKEKMQQPPKAEAA